MRTSRDKNCHTARSCYSVSTNVPNYDHGSPRKSTALLYDVGKGQATKSDDYFRKVPRGGGGHCQYKYLHAAAPDAIPEFRVSLQTP